MWGMRVHCSRSVLCCLSASRFGVLCFPCRRLSRQDILAAPTPADDAPGNDSVVLGSLPAAEEDAFTGEFDELEAASQEIHDLCYAMINYLQKVDCDETKDLFEKRCARRFRETVPENKRRLLHGYSTRSLRRRNCYRTRLEYEEATQLFLQFGEKLLLLLTKQVMDRIIESAGKGYRDHRHDGIHAYRKILEQASWRGFPHRWFKHAPFEVQQIRADISEVTVANTRAMRDLSTIRSLFTLMEPKHTFRSRLEDRMFEITQLYDPAHEIGVRV